MEANLFIANQLEQEARNRAGYGAAALLNSARLIRDFKEEIVDANQLKSVKGIGKGTLKRVGEILALGAEYQIPPPPPEEISSVSSGASAATSPTPGTSPSLLYDFTQLKFFGAVADRKLHEQGIHSLKTLEDAVAEGRISLQPNQLVGLEYRKDLAERIPRHEVEIIGNQVLAEVESQGMYGVITGSYRRGRIDSGDVDILITGAVNRLGPIITALKGEGLIQYIFSLGEVKLMAMVLSPGGRYRSLDIRFVPESVFGASLLFSTGPARFNIYQRQVAIDQDLKLSEYGITDAEHRLLPSETEEEVFSILGMTYLTPEERETQYGD